MYLIQHSYKTWTFSKAFASYVKEYNDTASSFRRLKEDIEMLSKSENIKNEVKEKAKQYLKDWDVSCCVFESSILLTIFNRILKGSSSKIEKTKN
jgi:hypothetical protein